MKPHHVLEEPFRAIKSIICSIVDVQGLQFLSVTSTLLQSHGKVRLIFLVILKPASVRISLEGTRYTDWNSWQQ
jgi:hypothetical protein